MITRETEALILRLHHAEKWPIGSIAAELGIHHGVVERVIDGEGGVPPKILRPSIIDPYLPFILETLKKYPRLLCSRLWRMCWERGYRGSQSHLRHVVQGIRPKPAAEAFLRLKTLPAEQAQVDWAHFGKVRIGRAERPLLAFLLVLSFSRWIFLRFFLSAKTECFLQGHVEAFAAAKGCPRVILYDNLKSAVLERKGDAIRFHPTLLEFAGHYRFEARPVAPYRGSEKGRVERAVRFVRDSFYAARAFRDLADLNAQARTWCDQVQDRPLPDDHDQSVRQAFARERPLLLPLPDDPFPVFERVDVRAGKTPYVRFDGNDYSVPHTKVRRELSVWATEDTVRVLEGSELLAAHRRSFDRRETIEDPAHLQALVQEKRQARKERGVDRLTRAAPTLEAVLLELANRGENLGWACSRLVRLLERYGAAALEDAAKEAATSGAVHPRSIEFILERDRRASGRPALLPVDLPDDARIRNLAVRPHALTDYDALANDPEEPQQNKEDDDDHDAAVTCPVA